MVDTKSQNTETLNQAIATLAEIASNPPKKSRRRRSLQSLPSLLFQSKWVKKFGHWNETFFLGQIVSNMFEN
jgi:hypothetical protein